MREILFRGKRRLSGNWYYGGYCKIDNAIYIVKESELFVEVIPETVGQYTGLCDKNDKKIFEGDIVLCRNELNELEFLAFVEFGNPNGEYTLGWQFHFITGTMANLDILCWFEMEDVGITCEVIGNICDNPEMLGGDA